MPHFIYCGEYYWEEFDQLRKIFLTKMRKYGIQSAILTMLDMWRRNLVTKEKTKEAYKGRLKNEGEWTLTGQSIHDDLETFFENLQGRKQIKNERVWSFFLPELTVDELKLVEEKDQLHLGSYFEHYLGRNPDVDAEEMKKSDSKSKYVHGQCWRKTIYLALKSNKGGIIGTLGTIVTIGTMGTYRHYRRPTLSTDSYPPPKVEVRLMPDELEKDEINFKKRKKCNCCNLL